MMNRETADNHIYRYERKFFISQLSVHEVESFIKHHPSLFSEIYHTRYVNNIYFDSVNMEDYLSNINGLLYRKKTRIRWYGDLFGNIENASLELKTKKGLLGVKQSYRFPSFFINNSSNVQTFLTAIRKSEIPESLRQQLKSLRPVLLNQYRRKYFLSSDKNYRITVDTDFKFFRINSYNNSFLHKMTNRFCIVLEVKYNQDRDAAAEHITNYFPFRITKSSKYVTGIELLYG